MGKRKITVGQRMFVSSGEVSPDNKESQLNVPTILHPSATLPRLKIKGAQYFLDLLKRNLLNEPATRYHIEAFVQFLRSATFVLQKIGSKVEGFNIWYEQKRKEMQQVPILSELIDLRNKTEKEGLVVSEYGTRVIMYFFKNGKIEARAAVPKAVVDNILIEDLIIKFEQMLETVSIIVEEAHEKGFVKIPESDKVPILMEFLRETDEGRWEHFDPQ
jgi:hypothetical protein